MSTSNRKTASFGVPWESAYGYVQAVRVNNSIFVSGQLSRTPEGQLVAPAALGLMESLLTSTPLRRR